MSWSLFVFRGYSAHAHDRLVAFTETMEAVVTRDPNHPKVQWPLEETGDQTLAGPA
jgi:hypothetical protein